jgi:NADH dehydrogenase
MRVLITGGSGVIGTAVVSELVARGHTVRLLSRHAEEDAKQWKGGVEPFSGDIVDAATLTGAASECDAVVHIAGIVAENPPKVTFEHVNVGGTRAIIEEAQRAGVGRFVHVSSLGADRGESDYHKSKLTSEQLVERSSMNWVVVRPGNVYGPGDEVISTILKMVRTLPAVPVIDSGDQPFQPIWHEDLARAIAVLVEKDEPSRRTLEIAGADVTTMNDLLEHFGEITGRKPVRVPVPLAIASVATRVAGAAASLPIDETKLQMLKENNVLREDVPNALLELGLTPTPLRDGLRALADALPEMLPEDGVGSLQHKKFFADISGSRFSAAQLITMFRERINDVMPIEFAAEPGAPTRVEAGATMTGAIPLRGNIQVRVEVVEPTRVVFATLEGHPLAGIVQFTAAESSAGVRFAVDVYARASNMLDFIAMKTVGRPAQSANWRGVVERMIEFSGGTSDGVHDEVRNLDDDEAEKVQKSVRKMVQQRQRDESPAPEDTPQR